MELLIKVRMLWCCLLVALCACSCKTTGGGVATSAGEKEMEKHYYFTEALKYDALNDRNKAHALFLQTLAVDSLCDACYYKLAEIYLQAGYIRDALAFGAKAVQLDSSNVWYRLQLCRTLVIVEEYDSVEKELDYLETKMGANEQLLLMRYEVLMHKRDLAGATKTLDALGKLSANPRVYSALGENYGALEQDSLSLHYYRQSLAMEPDYPPAMFGEMDTYRRLQRFDLFLEKLYAISANREVPMEMKVEYLSVLLKVPRFIVVFQPQLDTVFSLMRPRPDSLADPLYGSYLIQTGRSDSALSVFRDAAHAFKNDSDIWETFLGFMYYRQSWDSLKTYAAEAITLFPGKVNFMTLKAIALWQRKELHEAIDLLEKTLPLTKKDTAQMVQSYALLGDLYHEADNSKKAFACYDKVLAIDSSNVGVLNNYAYYLSITGKQLDKAYRMSRKTITAEPNNATYLDTFGWILYEMGKYVEAKAIFRHAMIYGGMDSAVILDHYGDVLNALGEKETAVVYWEMSYKKEPDPEVKKKLQ